MDIEQIVAILAESLLDDGESILDEVGQNALDIATEMRNFVQARLETDGEDSLWSDFVGDPEANAEELVGALEALVEADPGMADELEAYMEDYEGELEPDEYSRRNVAEPTAETPTPDEIPEAGMPANEDEDYNEEGTYLYGNVKGEVQR